MNVDSIRIPKNKRVWYIKYKEFSLRTKGITKIRKIKSFRSSNSYNEINIVAWWEREGTPWIVLRIEQD